MIKGSISFGDKGDAIMFINDLMEQFEISKNDLDYDLDKYANMDLVGNIPDNELTLSQLDEKLKGRVKK